MTNTTDINSYLRQGRVSSGSALFISTFGQLLLLRAHHVENLNRRS